MVVTSDSASPSNADRPPSGDSKSLGARPAEIASFLTSVFALFGAVAFAVIRPAVQIFYAQLGLRPEQVGISQASMVSRAAAIAGLALLLSVAGGLSGAAAFLLTRRVSGFVTSRVDSALAKRQMPAWQKYAVEMAPVVAIALLCAALIIILNALGGQAQGTSLFILSVIGLFVVVAALGAIVTSGLPWKTSWRVDRRILLLGGGGLILSVCTIVAATTWDAADSYGKSVISGHLKASEFNDIFGLVPGIAQVHTVKANNDPYDVCASDAVVYLGRDSDGTWVLLFERHNVGRVVRLDDADYRLVLGGESSQPCPK